MLEPRVGEDTVDAPHDVRDVAYSGLMARTVRWAKRHTTREKLDRGENVAGPVEGVDAVVDGAARFGRVVYSAQVLPF